MAASPLQDRKDLFDCTHWNDQYCAHNSEKQQWRNIMWFCDNSGTIMTLGCNELEITGTPIYTVKPVQQQFKLR